MAKKKGLNKHQKIAFKSGEHRVRGPEIERYLELAYSADPKDRLEAADNLCPCHVRRRIDEVWQALYRMMEDEDVRVRRAAWHTLEDGGCPVDPKLDPIFERALDHEKDKQVRRFVEMFARPRLQAKEQMALRKASYSRFSQRGRCDFCGLPNTLVRTDFETEIPDDGNRYRPALICEKCDL